MPENAASFFYKRKLRGNCGHGQISVSHRKDEDYVRFVAGRHDGDEGGDIYTCFPYDESFDRCTKKAAEFIDLLVAGKPKIALELIQ